MTTNGCGYDTSNDDARSVTKHARRLFEYAVPKISRMDKREEFGGCEKKKRKEKEPSVQLPEKVFRILLPRIIGRIDETIERDRVRIAR